MRKDLQFALRTLRRSPGFTLLAVLSLALGIGANTAVFSLLYQVVLRGLPVRDPGALAVIESNDYSFGETRRDNNQSVFSYPMYQALRDQNQVFTGLIARSSFPATLAYRGDALHATAEVVTGNFFEVLGVRPALGRLLLPSDDGVSGENPVVVLSNAYWTSHLGADPGVLNTQILLNGHPVPIAGVAPRSFRGLLPGSDPDFFAPVSMMTLLSPGRDNKRPDYYWLTVVGRLKLGVGTARAAAALLPLYRATLQDELPQFKNLTPDVRKKLLAKPILVKSAAQGLNALREHWQTPLIVLMAMAGLVLLTACANVANLLIARATARQSEMAIRVAVGASRWQLIRQLTAESAVLALAGGIVGIFLSENLTQGLLGMLPADAVGGWLAPQLDLRVLAYSLGLSLLTGILFGLAPLAQGMRSGSASALKQRTSGASTGSQSRTRQALIVAQICLSLLLLAGAGLFTRTLLALVHVDPGFRAGRLIAFSIDPGSLGYGEAQRMALFRDVQAKLGALPGVQSAARGWLIPLGGWSWGNGVKVPGSRNAAQEYANCTENSVSPGYFATLGIPLLAGRDFTDSDSPAGAKVAIVSETFARFLFENGNPIGRHLIQGQNDTDTEVVGVVKDALFNDMREKPPRMLYVPFAQGGDVFTGQSAFFIRSKGDEGNLMTAVRGVVKQANPNLPLDRLSSMQLMIDDSIYTDRLLATLAIAFGAMAAILAAIGLYGIVSYSVARRTREFGIRLALGADPQGVLLTVMREVGWLVAIGVAAGLPLSYLLARFAASLLYGIRPYDLITLLGATAMVVVVGLLAGLAPALRAMRIEPVTALRYE